MAWESWLIIVSLGQLIIFTAGAVFGSIYSSIASPNVPKVFRFD
jgi:hypothetical protein